MSEKLENNERNYYNPSQPLITALYYKDWKRFLSCENKTDSKKCKKSREKLCETLEEFLEKGFIETSNLTDFEAKNLMKLSHDISRQCARWSGKKL